MPNILVTGAGSGLGRAFVHEYAKNPSNTIYALDKHFPPDWHTTLPNPTIIHPTTLDLTSESSLTTYITTLPPSGISLLIHSAGIRGLVPSIPLTSPSSIITAESSATMTSQTLLSTFQINTIATFLLIRSLLPLFTPRAKVIVMSSRMGSMTSNTTGGGYAYRASKAALNAILKSFSLDFPSVTFLAVHPGRVETGLVPGVREEGAFSTEEVMPELVGLIGRVDGGWSGGFVDRFGEVIPW